MRYFKTTGLNVRRLFNPANKQDVEELKFFIQNNRWKNICPFYLEDPWNNIPVMCTMKFTKHALGVK